MWQNWTRNVIERIFRQQWMAFEDNEIFYYYYYYYLNIVLLSIHWMLGDIVIIPKYDIIYTGLLS